MGAVLRPIFLSVPHRYIYLFRWPHSHKHLLHPCHSFHIIVGYKRFSFKKFFVTFPFIFERKKPSTSGEGHRKRETQTPKQVPGPELSAQSQRRGSNPRTVRSWPEPKSDTELTKPPRRPNIFLFKGHVHTYTFCDYLIVLMFHNLLNHSLILDI